METLSAEEVAELKRLMEAATPGPWEWSGAKSDGYVPQCSYLGDTMICLADTYEGSRDDCALVQKLLNHAPALIAAAERDLELRTAPGAQT